MVVAYFGLLAVIAVERLIELRLSRRNVAQALDRGGLEFGRRHFPWMILLHSLFLPACALEVWGLGRPFVPALGLPMFAVVLSAQALRYAAILTLGRRWNVRVVVIPGEPAVTAGPYRFLRHPNYLAVVLEGFAIPLVHTAWLTALLFTALNAVLLSVRIRCEEAALAEYSDYEGRLAGRRRFVPTRRGAPMTDRHILDGIRAVLNELKVDRVVDPETQVREDLDLDSLQRIELVIGVENRFRVRLEPEDEEQIDSVGDLVDVLRKRLADGTHV